MASVTFLHVKLRDEKEAWLNPRAVEFVATDKDGDTLVGMKSGNTICPDLPAADFLELLKEARKHPLLKQPMPAMLEVSE